MLQVGVNVTFSLVSFCTLMAPIRKKIMKVKIKPIFFSETGKQNNFCLQLVLLLSGKKKKSELLVFNSVICFRY